MYKKKSFFSGSTIANVVAGMFIYHMTSNLVSGLLGGGFSKRPVNVYNYYNHPEVKEEIKLPSNVLTLCEGNSTKLCTSGKTSLFLFSMLISKNHYILKNFKATRSKYLLICF